MPINKRAARIPTTVKTPATAPLFEKNELLVCTCVASAVAVDEEEEEDDPVIMAEVDAEWVVLETSLAGVVDDTE